MGGGPRIVVTIFESFTVADLKDQMTTLRVQSTLSLRKIDPVTVAQDYQSGKYVNLPPGLVQRSTEPANPHYPTSLPSTPGGKNLITSSFRDKNNVTIHLITTNTSKTCMWCGLSYQDAGLGIPTAFEIVEDAHGNPKYIYTLVGSYNTLECTYADLKRNSSQNVYFRNARYVDSESLLRLLAHSMTGSNEIKEALPREFLDINGGPMSSVEYLQNLHTYTPVSNVRIIHGSNQYFRT